MAGVHNAIEAKMSHSDPEVTVFTPSASPRVSCDPIVDSIIVTPSDYFDGVPTHVSARRSLVYTRSVVVEICVDLKGSFDRSSVSKFAHHVGDSVDVGGGSPAAPVLPERVEGVRAPTHAPRGGAILGSVGHALFRNSSCGL